MNIQEHFSPKNLKRTWFVLLAIATFFGMFWYVNTYLYKFFAAGTTVSVNFSPATVSTSSGSEFSVSLLMSGQKISATEFYIEYDANLLEYAKEYTTTGFSQPGSYFEDPLIESVTMSGTKKTLKLSLVTLQQNQTTDAKQIALKFKAKASANGTATIKIVDPTKLAGVDEAGSPMYFDKNITTGTVTVTITPNGNETPTPTMSESPPPPTSVTLQPTMEPTPSGPSIHIDMTDAYISRKETANEFTIGVKLDGQTDVAGVELYISYPDALQYAKEFTPSVSGFTQQGDYFEAPIVETVTSNGTNRQLKLALVTLTDTPMPANYIINLKFRAISEGIANISILDSTKVSGVSNNNAVFFNVITSLETTTVPVGVDGPTPTPGDGGEGSVTPAPTDDGGGGGTGNVALNVKLRYQGIVKQPDVVRRNILTSFTLVSSDGSIKQTTKATVNAQPDATWTGTVAFQGIDTSKKYSLFVKGEKHLQKEICITTPTESIPGSYHCPSGAITLKVGQNTVDLTGIILLAGDIPEQNGIVDAVDFSLIRQNFGSQSQDIIARGDLNYDGIVDTQDYSLVLAALAFKYDEE